MLWPNIHSLCSDAIQMKKLRVKLELKNIYIFTIVCMFCSTEGLDDIIHAYCSIYQFIDQLISVIFCRTFANTLGGSTSQ